MFILSNYYIEIGILLLLFITIIVYIIKYFEPAKIFRKATKVAINKDGWLISGADIKLTISDVQLNAARLGITIGRSAKLSELLINDDSVSHRHARIYYINNDLYIEDLNSLNGLWINNEALKPFEKVAVKSGETLVFGELAMSFKRL